MRDFYMDVLEEEQIPLDIDGIIYAAGGGGTTDYNALQNKPSINGVTLQGNKTDAELGITTALMDELNVTTTVGGAKSGTKYDTGERLEKVLRDILNPVINPTLTNPSASINTNIPTLLEKGETRAATLTVVFSRGSINPKFSTSGYRSGVATLYEMNGGDAQDSKTFNTTVSETNKEFVAVVTHEEGEQPVNSAGQPYQAAYPAGTVTSSKLTFDFEYPIYSNAADIKNVSKEPLIRRSVGERIFNFPDSTTVNAETFDMPATWNVISIMVRNELSNLYEEATDSFSVSDVIHQDAAGNDVEYKRYMDARGYDSGNRDVKVIWN